jgi:hypothetical protein
MDEPGSDHRIDSDPSACSDCVLSTCGDTMERKLWGFFSATHVVAIITVITLAIAVPSGVWAVSFTYNALYNPSNGQTGYIDAARRLWVYDTQQALSHTPANFVRLSGFCDPSSKFSYTPPTGRALIITSADFSYYGGISGGDNYVYLVGPGAGYISGIESSDSAASKNADLGNGYYLRNQEVINVNCGAGEYRVALVGYLVASGAVPPAGAAGQSSVSPHVMKGGKRL